MSGVAELPTGGPWSEAALGGARAAATALHDAVVTDRLSHAWLLVGPDGVGQQQLAVALASHVNCREEDAAARPCTR
jgi:DNA polymerase III gamma/tau subunit